MSLERKDKARQRRRVLRVRNKLRLGKNPFRISVFRSNRFIYGQLINDEEGKTIASFASCLLKDEKGDKSEIAKRTGMELAKRCLEKGVDSAIFDRGRFLYHGRVKAFADGLKEGGFKI